MALDEAPDLRETRFRPTFRLEGEAFADPLMPGCAFLISLGLPAMQKLSRFEAKLAPA